MKTTNRFVFGLASSLLLAAGFVRAADRLDPVLKGSTAPSKNSLDVAEDCGVPTWAIGDGS
jgi:hypothetical protein